MDWRKAVSKFNLKAGKPGRDKWALLLVCGILLLLAAAPVGGKKPSPASALPEENSFGQTDLGPVSVKENLWSGGESRTGKGKKAGTGEREGGEGNGQAGSAIAGAGGENAPDSSAAWLSYERQMEERVKELLKNTEGVGEVDVMIVLKASEEKVLRVDQSRSRSSTEESDSGGGSRRVMSEETSENTIFSENGSEKTPVVEKELRPEIEGIVISAQGGGNAAVRAEISEAMEALFNIPAHKIKVLKRVD